LGQSGELQQIAMVEEPLNLIGPTGHLEDLGVALVEAGLLLALLLVGLLPADKDRSLGGSITLSFLVDSDY
jgi:hypothetical protein